MRIGAVMGGRGPAPKPDSERVRRNEPVLPTVEVAASGDLRGPELPSSPLFWIGHGETLEALREWPDQTVAWWEAWRRSPQAAVFTDTDWSFLLDTAMLHGAFWYGETKHAGELRLRAAKFGATVEDRARLRMAVVDPGLVDRPVVDRRPAAARRKRILRAVEDEPA